MTTETIERRFADWRVDVRLQGAENRTIGGYAAVFNKRSDPIGGRFIEIVDRRAFNQASGKNFPGLVALYNHDQNLLLGTTNARTLRADVDDSGLFYEVDLPSSRSDLYELVQRGDVAKSSFAFRVAGKDGEEWEWDDQANMPKRTLLNLQVFDVSPVNVPAYRDSSVGLRSSEIALRGLATAKEAPLADVVSAAAEGELRRFFKRTDAASPEETTAAAALSLVMSKAKR